MTRQATGVALMLLTMALSAAAEIVRLGDGEIALGFDSEASYALTQIEHIRGQVQFLKAETATDSRERGLWRIAVRAPDGSTQELFPEDAAAAETEVSDNELRFVWTGVSGEPETCDLTVEVSVRLMHDTGRTEWRLAVNGRSAGALWEVEFPRVRGMGGMADDQIAVPQYLGRLVRSPTRHRLKYRLAYPQPASMQYSAYWGTPDVREPALPEVSEGIVETGWAPDRSDAAGLYWAAEDGDGWFKQFNLDTRPDSSAFDWSVTHIPGLTTWPLEASAFPAEVSYAVPYPVVVTVFTGDYHEAGALYRGWASEQVWCRRGPLSGMPQEPPAAGSEDSALWTPAWFRDLGFWAKFYHEPAKILPEWEAYRRWLRVPMASHYYRYTIARFDDNYPEPLPGDPYLLRGVRAARELGVRPLPYINGVIWDSDTQSWIRENGFASSIKSETGAFVPWDIRGELFAHMCPATEQWRAKMRETCRKLIWEHGMAGVYLDCLAATGVRPCYDATHGHTARGGAYRAAGNRKLMFDLRRDIRQVDSDASFFTEEIGEQYIDVMDGFLTLDFTRSGSQAGERVFPVFSTVYHPYTINFGSDAALDMPEPQFALEYGLLFLWGCQPLISALVAVPPREGDANSNFLREVTQAYTVAGKPFLQDGRWERIAVVPRDAPPSACGLELRSDAVTIPYEKRRFPRIWSGPAVAATAWRNGSDLGVVMVNLTAEEKRVTLTLDRGRLFGAATDIEGVCLWPAGGKLQMSPSREIVLPPRSVRIEAFGPSPDRLRGRLRRLDDVHERLVTAEDGKPFEPLIAPDGALWACSDSALRIRAAEVPGTVALEPVVTDCGVVTGVRTGRQAEVSGHRAEGHSLPRGASDQPFMLLRKLPHRVGDRSKSGDIVVFGGDRNHVDMRIDGGGTVTFERPGVVLLRDLGSGQILRDLTAGATDRVTVVGDSCLLVYVSGLSSLAAAAQADAERAGSAREEAAALAEAIRRFETAPNAAALATATQNAMTCVLACGDAPELPAPGRPLVELIACLNSLVRAVCGMTGHIELDNDWLSAGIEKRVRVMGERLCPTAHTLRRIALHPLLPDAPERVTVTSGAASGSGGTVAEEWRVLLRDGLYVERLVPVVAVLPLASRSRLYRLLALDWLEANRPVEIRVQSGALTAVAGRESEGDVVFRNWSPYPVQMSISATGPGGWLPVCEPEVVDIPPLADGRVRVAVGAPADAGAGTHSVRVDANHCALPGSGVAGFLTVSLFEAMVPVDAAAYVDSGASEAEPPQLRKRGLLVFYAEAGMQVAVTIENVRVTRYVDTLEWRLLDPALKPVEKGRIPVDRRETVELTAPSTGAYFVEVTPKSGSARVTADGVVMNEMASYSHPLELFCSPVTRTFYVAPGARRFTFGATDGGPTETARVVLRSPTGRVALDRDGNWGGADLDIEVLPGEDGGLWVLQCIPQQDISLWLGAGATPCLSPVPGAALRGRR